MKLLSAAEIIPPLHQEFYWRGQKPPVIETTDSGSDLLHIKIGNDYVLVVTTTERTLPIERFRSTVVVPAVSSVIRWSARPPTPSLEERAREAGQTTGALDT